MMKNNIFKAITGISIIALLAQIFFACNPAPGHKNGEPQKTIPGKQFLKKPPSSFEDTLAITFPSAVFYNPDSLQLEKIKSINNKMIFESLTHDCFFQMRNARMVLKKYWPHIHIIETSKARYLLFIKADGSKTVIDLNAKNDICGIFIFDRLKDPELIDMMNVDTELGFYFKK